jgi:predicted transcriptional regulator
MKLTPRQREVIEWMQKGWTLSGSGLLFAGNKTYFMVLQGRTINSMLDKGVIVYKQDVFRHYELTQKGKEI